MLTFDILIDTDKCAQMIRETRWSLGVECTKCHSHNIKEVKTRPDGIRQYRCISCGNWFTDITGTIFEKSHLPISRWFLGAYLLKFNLSDRELAAELGVEENTARRLAELIRASAFFRDELHSAAVSRGSR